MVNYTDSKFISFEDLRKIVDEDGNRVYSERLIEGIQSGNLNYLYEIDAEKRNNKFFMEPLLYAVKHNSIFSSYEVYKYYGEELQKSDFEIATEIVLEEPEIIEGTAISKDGKKILQLAQINPEVILYMSDDLKNDGEFIEDLCETGNIEAIAYAIDNSNAATLLQDNPELANNPEFMKEAIKEDASILQYADENLKNNYEFIKEASMRNRNVIDYVAEHTNEFGKDALDGARYSLEENVKSDVIKDIAKEREKIIEERQKNNTEELDKREKDLNSIEDAIRKFEETPDEKKPRRAYFILVCAKDNIPEHYRKELEKYEQLYIAAKEKEKTEKIKDEKNNLEITPEQIEHKTNDARISEINNTTKDIRGVYIRQTEEKEVKKYDRGIDE